MNVGSLFSGIGGLDLGLHRAGWEHAFFCESDGYRRDVLRARWPGVPVYDDVAIIARGSDARADERGWLGGRDGTGAVDLLCGGFPCQDLSVAGRRKGFAGERSSLFFEFARVADTLRPRWLLIENVPGLFSSNGGRDFGELLGTLADIGYGVAWRTLDSRFFGVPQRRRRVFIVGVLADGDPAGAAERAGEILAVGQGCDRHSAKSEQAGSDIAVAPGNGLGEGGYSSVSGELVDLAPPLDTRAEDGPRRNQDALLIAAPLSHGSNPNSNTAGQRREDDENLVTAFYPTGGSKDGFWANGISPPMKVGTGVGAPAGIGVTLPAGVRRLTPVECERLQALPDGWTELGGTPDSRRYAALGDAVTASVAEWIGRRLLEAA